MACRPAVGALALVLVCGVAPAPAERAPFDVEALRARIRTILAEGTTPSLAAAVARNGQIVWSEAFGLADREARVAATVETPYSIASLTKPFTATALMILHERGRLDLDAPLSRYLGPLDRPGVSSPDEVTIRRVLGHVAGFPTHYQYFFDDRPERPLPFADTMRCYGAGIHAPGSGYTYSNLGFGALGETVARASGLSYRDFLAREVFAPLGLRSASVPERAGEVVGAARRYARDGSPLPFYVTDFPGASAVFASVEDVVRFGSFHAGALMEGQRPVLTPASVAAMQRKGDGDYGLGWSVNDTRYRHPVIWHSGAMPGSSATLWLVPAETIAIAVIANQIAAPVNQLAGEILAALLPNAERPAPPSRANERTRPPAPGPARGAAATPAGRYRGRLLSCPEAEALAIDVEGPETIALTLGSTRLRLLEGTFADGRLYAGFGGTTGPTRHHYQFDLRLAGNRLTGPVLRRTSLGPRANMVVTLWAELERQP